MDSNENVLYQNILEALSEGVILNEKASPGRMFLTPASGRNANESVIFS